MRFPGKTVSLFLELLWQRLPRFALAAEAHLLGKL